MDLLAFGLISHLFKDMEEWHQTEKMRTSKAILNRMKRQPTEWQ